MRSSVFSFRFASTTLFLAAALGFGALASGSDFSNGLFGDLGNDGARASERLFSKGLFEVGDATFLGNQFEIDGTNDDVGRVDVDFDPTAFADESRAFADRFSTFEQFAPLDSVGAEPLPRERSTATVGANGVSFSQDAIVRGSVRLPRLNAIQIWGNGYAGGGKIRPRSTIDRFKEKPTGATIGLTTSICGLSTSGYYNYHKNKLTFNANKIEQKTNLFGLGIYPRLGSFYFSLTGTYGDDAYSARNPETDAKLDGYQGSGYFETGYEMPTLGLFVLKPFGSYQYSYLEHDAFDAATFAKGSGKQNYDALYMTLGSRIDINLGGLDSFTLQARSAWVSQLRSQNEAIQNFCFGRIPGTISATQPYFASEGAGSDYFWGGVGLRLSLFGAFSAAIDYDCLVNKYQTLHVGSAALLIGF